MMIFTLVFFSYSGAGAGLLHTYNELTLMDLDQINQLVTNKLKESKKSHHGKAIPLKEAFQAVYARPDTDRMIQKVITPIRSELQDLQEYERIVQQLTDEALNALKHTKNFRPQVQVTYAIFLENLMADFKSAAFESDGFEREVIRKIQKAKIKLTKEAKNDRNHRGFKETKSPSETAEAILDSINAAERKKVATPEETDHSNSVPVSEEP